MGTINHLMKFMEPKQPRSTGHLYTRRQQQILVIKYRFFPMLKQQKLSNVLICSECEKPSVVYAANKLSGQEMKTLERIKQLFQYTCGSSLQELHVRTDDNRTPRINALLDKCYVRGNNL